jgi:hypothetical protein
MNPQGDISTLLTMGTFLLWLDTRVDANPLEWLILQATLPPFYAGIFSRTQVA